MKHDIYLLYLAVYCILLSFIFYAADGYVGMKILGHLNGFTTSTRHNWRHKNQRRIVQRKKNSVTQNICTCNFCL